MNDWIPLIAAALALAVGISAALRSRHYDNQAVAAMRVAEAHADRAQAAAARAVAALRDKAAAIRRYANIAPANSLDYQWAVLAVADDLDRAADRLDPKGPGMRPAAGGVSPATHTDQ